MAEYIEREALMVALCKEIVGDGDYYNGKDDMQDQIRDMVSRFPAADVATVRNGRWEEMHYEGGILDGTNFDRCSVCGYERVFGDPAFKTVFKYCPNCGAMMDGGAD